MPRTILHVDMDAFYAAVEQRDRPELRGKPVIVGSDPKGGKGRGIVSTCSYEARRFGVHSAQPISQAWRLCPQGVYVQPDMRKYARVSRQIMEILSSFTDMVEQISVDEAFLDVTGSRQLYGTGREIAAKIKDRMRRELGLTASVGVASNKFVAKIASDLEKPDGLVVVEPGREREFLAPLAVRRLWGVGPKTEAALQKAGLRTVGQIAALDERGLRRRLGEGDGATQLWRLARGMDDRPVEAVEGCKSIGHETTFERDTSDFDLLHATLLALVEKTAHRMRLEGVRGRTVTVKFREEDFATFTRRATLDAAVDTSEKIFPVALDLMKGLFREGVRVRLVGVSLSNLGTDGGGPNGPGRQLGLFRDGPTEPLSTPRERKLAEAIDDISQRFGDRAITRATLVEKTRRP